MTNFMSVQQENLASYDFYDLATGTGYKEFYAADLSGSCLYVLTTQAIYGDKGRTTFTNVAGELNFDLDIEVPLYLDGTALLCVPVTTGDDLGDMSFGFRLLRVDANGTETAISNTATYLRPDADANNTCWIMSVKLEIDNAHLKAGEKLRLECTSSDAGAGKTIYFMHDPKNRDLSVGANFVTSILNLILPIRI